MAAVLYMTKQTLNNFDNISHETAKNKLIKYDILWNDAHAHQEY